MCGLADDRGANSSAFAAIIQFRTLVGLLRLEFLLLAVIAVITFAYGGMPE